MTSKKKVEKKRRRAATEEQTELSGMPGPIDPNNGRSIPKEVQELAKDVALLDRDIDHMKEDLKTRKADLKQKMLNAEISVVVVIHSKVKYRVKLSSETTTDMEIEEIGIEAAKEPKEKGPIVTPPTGKDTAAGAGVEA